MFNCKYMALDKLKISKMFYSPCNLVKNVIIRTNNRKQIAPSFRISAGERRISSISGQSETPPPTLRRSMLCLVSRCLLIKVCLSLFTRPTNIYKLNVNFTISASKVSYSVCLSVCIQTDSNWL